MEREQEARGAMHEGAIVEITSPKSKFKFSTTGFKAWPTVSNLVFLAAGSAVADGGSKNEGVDATALGKGRLSQMVARIPVISMKGFRMRLQFITFE